MQSKHWKFFDGSGNATLNYAVPCYGMGIVNTGTAPLSFTVNGNTGMLDVGESFEDDFLESFTQIQITATGSWKGNVRRV